MQIVLADITYIPGTCVSYTTCLVVLRVTVFVPFLGFSRIPQYLVMLIGGAHRLAAVAECAKDWPTFLGEAGDARLPWAESAF